MAAKTNASRALDTLKIPYTLHEYDWDEDQLDAVTVANKVGLPPQQTFKTLVLKGDKTGFLTACIPGDRELDLKALASLSGNKKVEMVPVKDIQNLTGYIRGGVSPLGMKKKFPMYMEESITTFDPISVSAGKRGMQMFVKGEDLVRAVDGTLGKIVL